MAWQCGDLISSPHNEIYRVSSAQSLLSGHLNFVLVSVGSPSAIAGGQKVLERLGWHLLKPGTYESTD